MATHLNPDLLYLGQSQVENLLWVGGDPGYGGGSTWHLYQWGLPPHRSWTESGKPDSFPSCVPICGADPYQRVNHEFWITFQAPTKHDWSQVTWDNDDFCHACIYQVVNLFPNIFERSAP